MRPYTVIVTGHPDMVTGAIQGTFETSTLFGGQVAIRTKPALHIRDMPLLLAQPLQFTTAEFTVTPGVPDARELPVLALVPAVFVAGAVIVVVAPPIGTVSAARLPVGRHVSSWLRLLVLHAATGIVLACLRSARQPDCRHRQRDECVFQLDHVVLSVSSDERALSQPTSARVEMAR